MTIGERFNLRNKIAVVMGGAGYLCSTLAQAMDKAGMRVVVLDVAVKPAKCSRGVGSYLRCDVTSKRDLLHKR